MLAGQEQPIIAIATPPGRGAVGIVRISGRKLERLIHSLLGRSLQPRHATYLPLTDNKGEAIDQVLAIHFPSPHSYSGEDVLELQGHGGAVVLQLVLARCLELAQQRDTVTGQPILPALRLARPGEFTQRAFLNDKMDLAQAEAIADLIDASTEAAARSASRSLEGAFSREIAALRDGLIQLRMLVEATLDFPEEEVDFLQKADAKGQLDRLLLKLKAVLAQARQGSLLREGIRIVIAGQPNVGKSSLLNALAGAELAIVTPVPGTTRDKVQQTIQIDGVPLHVIDTAGLRESEDEVEKIGIERAWDEIVKADALLFLHDLTRRDSAAYQAAEEAISNELARRLPKTVATIDIWNKSDIASGHSPELSLSAKTGAGLEALRQRLLQTVGWRGAPEGLYMARERHLQALRRVQAGLEHGRQLLAHQAQYLDLFAEDLRMAQSALNEITGEFTPDDLLGVIFAKFCIGK